MGAETEINVRVCPSCGRRLPRKVTTCRCGLELPEDTRLSSDASASQAASLLPVESTTSSSSSPTSPLVLVLGLVVLAALGYGAYRFMQPAPAGAPASESPRRPGGAASAATTPDGAAPPEEKSAARREWDLAANVKPAIPVKPTDTPADKTALEDVISGAMPAIVRIETPQGSGSGFYVRNDTLVTNRHVVTDNTEVTVRRGDGSSVTARVDQKGSDVDIAILKVAPVPNQTVIPMGTSVALRLGQELILIGSPFGVLQNSVSRGIVSALRESEGVSLVQTDAAANPGNSGGPMLDRTGTAVGITTMSYRGSQGVNFAVAIDHAVSMIEGRGTMVKAGAAPSARSIGGTPANPGFTQPSPAQFDADRVRDEAQKGYEGMLDRMSKDADAFDTAWNRFKGDCYSGAIVGSFGHEWFALLDPAAMPDPLGRNCGPFLTEMKSLAGQFRDSMRQGEEAARRAGVFPGVMRDARRSRRLDFPW